MSNIQPIRGTHDLIGKKLILFNLINKAIHDIANCYDFKEIITPIFENTNLFKKPLGENSDVVLKEMYSFEDRNKSSLTLRPEYTTPFIRAAISNNLFERLPIKLFGLGPMFRRERPQKGRYRQFYQINFEYFSKSLPESDVELITLAYQFLKEINIPIQLHINSLGDNISRQNYKKNLLTYLNKYKNDLSEDSITRLEKNPLRILDSKEKKDLKVISNAPKLIDFLSEKSLDYYKKVKDLLTNLDINFTEDNNLVRGLDYYKETVFEFKTSKLGNQQDTILGGGRYSGLIKMFGGDDIDGAGWAAGLDRLIEIHSHEDNISPKVSIIFNEKNRKNAFIFANKIRSSKKIRGYVEFLYELSEDKQLKKANKIKSQNIIFIENNLNIKILNKKTNKSIKISINDLEKIIDNINDN